MSLDQNVSNLSIYCEILEQFDTGRLNLVQNLCQTCQFFLSDFESKMS